MWSDRIEDELRRTIITLRTQRGRDLEETQAYVTRLFHRMNTALPDARVTAWPNMEDAFSDLPDPNDAHVIAAATAGRVDVIVTFNRRDFPGRLLPGALFSQSPDDFLLDLWGLQPTKFESAMAAILGRTGRRGPRWTREDLLDRLEREQLPGLVSVVRDAP